MQKITKYAIFNYNEVDSDLIDLLSKSLDECGQDIYDFFNYNDIEKCNINIISTKEEFDKRLKERRNDGKEIAKWVIGVTTPTNDIEYLSLHDYKNTSHASILDDYQYALEYYKKTIIHEYVHFVNVLYTNCRNYPYPLKCLLEGIAQLLSKQKENLKCDYNFTLEDLFDSDKCYNGWYLTVKYIIEVLGKDYFLNLFKDRDYAKEEIKRLYPEIKEYYDLKRDYGKVRI